jgi:hypothetical protein
MATLSGGHSHRISLAPVRVGEAPGDGERQHEQA